ncbi:mucin-6 [Myotis myotis]|uniref:mucin-6 n=1 Tax=Myotis myotis TaxID=51298 RepID=UPI00174B091B|nr:mucin-6 [Myotis myotis]
MLGPRLLLLLSCGGALLGAGLDDTSFAHPGPQGLKDSPQPAPGRGWCSTWGTGHFFTFDGHMYDFEGTCNYIFAAICKDASSPTFSVQLRRGPGGDISRVIVELGASVVTVQQGAISIKDVGAVSPPYTSNGLQITPFGQSVRLVAKQLELELVVVWGPGAHLMVLVEDRHMGRMCGLCGNFDGEKTNEFLSEDGTRLEPHKYAALQKLDDPNEICTHEAIPGPQVLQAEHARTCAQLLALVAPECNVPKEPFVQSCQADVAACARPGQQSCACATLSEYSRHCSLAGQPVSRWRRPGLCSLGQCPANQVYQECGEACVKTCSNPQHSCARFCTFGCFCPEGMVLDDVSKNLTCVPIAQCPCTLGGVAYAPGEVTADACRTCQCTMGRWKCEERPCPRRCALEGGSFVTTFDARPYRFHGTCTYTLLQSPQLPDGGSLMAAYDKSGYSHSETSLVALIYVSSQDKIVISQDEVVTNHGDTKWLPYKTGNITVFKQTSTHLQMATTFGLELVVQLQPVLQAYVTVGPQFRGQTRGLCGNFNGDTTDDFTTSMGVPEGTASLFVDSWRAGNCPAALERETDPCSMSQLNKVCAETHCAVLVNKGTVFERCHAVVNPKPFYRRCVYQACNYEETFPHICAALGDYAHTCASRGILLWGWRSSVDNCTIPCTGNQTYSYDSRACGRTCFSLSDRAAECHPSAVPVEGCNCPEGTYLNHKAECVRKAHCPCLLDNHKLILAGQSTVVEGVICYCSNGRLSCPGRPSMLLASCSAPKTFQSCSQSSRNKFGAACAPTCQMLATGTPCVPTKCEPGCVCAEGLYENASGQCVPPEECPCEFAGVSYPRGAELHTDCKACTCSRGKWTCQQSAHCSSTCTLYGEGHVVTFDGQRFVFEGSCEYILATDGCGTNDSRPTFKILTENVVCGKSGVTCSRAIRMFLGGLSIVLADRNYTVSGTDPQVHFRVRAGSLHLVLDVTIGSSYNLTLIWNKHMTVSIKISRASQDALCGLCGNYNGNMKDDFETRSKYVASSELEFVNSWKESPLCGDARLALDPCSLNAFRRAWAERKCSIINSQTFAACHSQVYRLPYYEACVRDTCGCDTGGDCECLCDAVAAYAKACLDKGVCVDWRAPDFCPIYCDFYNSHTRAGDGQYQHTPETNCTWHYQPCLCPQQLQSLPDTNIEGCYNCSQDEYFDQDTGTCVQCMLLPTTPPPPTTGDCAHTRSQAYLGHPQHHSHPQNHWAPQFHGTLTKPPRYTCNPHGLGPRLHTDRDSPDPAARTHSLLRRSAHRNIIPDHHHLPNRISIQDHSIHSRSKLCHLLCHSHFSQSDHHNTTRDPLSFHLYCKANRLLSIIDTRPCHRHSALTLHSAVDTYHKRNHPSPSLCTLPSPSTVPWTPTTRGTTQAPHSVSTAKTSTSLVSHPSAPAHSGTTSAPRTTISTKTTSRGTGSPGTHTATATPNSPHTPFTSHSPHTGSVSTTSHITGPPTGTSFRTTTTFPTASPSKTTQSTHVPNSATSSVTPTSHRVITTTQPETHSPSISTARPTGSSPSSTHVPATGTVPSPSTVPWTPTTRGTTQAPHSVSTAKTSTSLVSHPSAPAHSGTTSAPRTTISTKTTSRGTGSPGTHTATATPNGPHTPFTSHSPHTGSVSTTSHITGPPTGTSFRTTTTFPTASPSKTTQSTHVPNSATSSVTPTSHRVITTTQPETHSPSISTARPTGSSPSSTHVPATGTVPSPSTVPWTPTTTGTTQAPHSVSTAKTSTSLVSHPSAPAHSGTTSAPRTTISTKTTSRGTGSPGTHTATASATPDGPHTPFTTHSPHTGSLSSTSHITGPPTGTSFRTTTTFPTASPSKTTQSTHVPNSATSSVTPTSHRVITTTQHETHSPSISTARPTGSSPSSTHVPATGTLPSPSTSDHHNTTRDPLSFHLYCKANRLFSIIDTRPCHRHSALTLHSAVDTYHKRNHPSPSLCQHSQNLHLPGVTPLRTCPLWHHICSTHHHLHQDHQSAHRNIIPDHHHLPNRISIQDHSIHSRSKLCHLLCHSHFSQSDHHNTTRDPLSFHLYCKANRLLSIIDTRPCHRHSALPLHSAVDTYHKRNHPSPSLCQHSQNLHLPGVTPLRTCPLWHHICSTHHHLHQDHQSTDRNIIPDHHHLPNRISIQDHSIHSRSKLCHLLCHSHFSQSDHHNTTRDPLSFHLYCKANRLFSIIDTCPCHRHSALTLHSAVDTYHKRNHPSPSLCTVPSLSTVPWTPTTRGTTQAPHSVSTAKTSTSLVSHPSAPAHSGTTSAPRTTISTKTTSRGTGSPGTHTATATPNGPHTPFTSHSPHTGSVSTTSHITGPPTGTSFRTTTTFPTASPSKTTQSTHVPNSATSSVTPTSHRVITTTQPETHSPSISTARPTGSSPSSTHVPATGTVPSPSTVPWTPTTRGTTQAPHSVSTAKTSTSLVSHPSAPAHSGTTSAPRTTISTKTTSRGTGSPGTHTATASATPNGPHTPFTTHSPHTGSLSSTSHITGPPTGTSFRTTTTFPTASPSKTTQSTHVPNSATSSVTPTSHRVITTTQPETHSPSISTARPTGSSPSSTHVPATGTVPSPSTVPWTPTTRGTTQAPHSVSTAKTSTSLVSHPSAPAHSGTTSAPRTTISTKTTSRGTGSPGTHTATATPNGPHTPFTSHSPHTGSVSTTSHITGPPTGTSFRTTTTFPTASPSKTTQSTHVPNSATSSVTPTSHRVITTTQSETHSPSISTARPTGSSPSSTHVPATGTVPSPSTVPWTPTTRGTTQAPHSVSTAKTSTSLVSHPSAPAHSGTTSAPRTTISTKTTSRGTGSPGTHTATATPNGPHTPFTSHSPHTGSVSTTSHITGPPTGTSFRTTTTFPTASPSKTTQSTHVPNSATSSVTPTSHRVITTTQPETHSPSISTARPTGSSPSSTHVPATGTVPSPSTVPWTPTTRGTTQAPHSVSTAKTSTSLVSHPSAPAHSGTTSAPRTTISTKITSPPTGTSFRTTTTFPTASPSKTTQSTHSDHHNTTRDPLSFHLYCKANRLLSIIDTRPCHRHTALTLHSAVDTYHKRNHPSPSLCQHSQNLHLPGVTPLRTCPLWHHICSTHHHLHQDHQSTDRNIIPDHHHLPNRISIQDHSIHSRSKLCHLLCHSHFSQSDHHNTTRDPLSFHLYCKANRLFSIIDTCPCHRHSALTLHSAVDTYHKRNHPSPSLCQHSQNLHLPGVTPLRTCPLWHHICSTHHHLHQDHQSAHRNIIPDHHHLPNRISIQDHSIHSRSKLCHLLCHAHFSQSDHHNTTRDPLSFHLYCKANRLFSIIDTRPCHRHSALTLHSAVDTYHKRNHPSPSLCQHSQNLHLPGVTPLRTCPLWHHICSTHHHLHQDHQSAHRNIIPDHHHLPNRISIQDHSIHSRSKLCHLLCHSHFSQSDHHNTTRDPLSFHLYCKANRLLSIIDTRPCHRHTALTLHSAVDTYHKRNHPSPSLCQHSQNLHLPGVTPLRTCPLWHHICSTHHHLHQDHQSTHRNIIPDHHHLPNRISIQDHSIHSRSKLCHLLCHSHFSQSDHHNTTRDPLSFHLYCKANRLFSIIDTRPCHRHSALTLHSAVDTYHKRNHPSPSLCQHSQNLHLPGVTPLRTCPLWHHICSTHHHLHQDHQSAHRNIIPDHHHLPNRISIQDHSIHSRSKLCHLLCHSHFSQSDHHNTIRDPLSFHLYCKANRLLSIIDTRPCHRHSALTLHSAVDTYHKRNHPSPSLCQHSQNLHLPGVTPLRTCPLWHHICSTHHHLHQDHQSAHRNIIPDHHHLPNRISIQDHSIHSRSKLCHLLCHAHFSQSDHHNTTRDPLSFHLYCKANRLLSIIDTRPCHRHSALTLHSAVDTYHKRNHPSPSLCQHSQNLHLPGVTPLRTCPLWHHICSTHHHLHQDHQSAHRNIIPDHHHLPNRISIQDHSIHSRSKLCHLLCHAHFSQSDHHNTTRDPLSFHLYCKANRLFSIIDTRPCHRHSALTLHSAVDTYHKRNHPSPSLCQHSQNLHLPGVTPLRTCPLWHHICSTHHHLHQDHQSAHRNIIPDHHHLPNRISIQDHSIHSRSKLCHLLCHSHFSQSDHHNTTRDPLSFHLYCKANRLLSIIDTRPCHRHTALTLHSAVDTYHKRNHPSPSLCQHSQNLHLPGVTPLRTCPLWHHICSTHHHLHQDHQSTDRNIIPDHHHLPNRISIQDHSIHSRSKLCHLLCHSHFSQSDHHNTTRDPLSFHLYCKANRLLSIIDTCPCHRHSALTLHSAVDTYHKRNHPSPSLCQHSQNLHLPGVTPLRTCPLWHHICSTHHHLHQDHQSAHRNIIPDHHHLPNRISIQDHSIHSRSKLCHLLCHSHFSQSDHHNTTRDPLSFHLYCKANRLLSIIDTRPCHRHSALTLHSAVDTYHKRNHPSPSLCSEPSQPDTPMPAEVCRVRELEEELTYQGCTANVTVTRCEGVCASSASFNAYTNQVDTLCSCCHPLGSYEKQLVLPCPDPGAPGKQLVLTLQVFKRCACGPWRCRDQGQPPW